MTWVSQCVESASSLPTSPFQMWETISSPSTIQTLFLTIVNIVKLCLEHIILLTCTREIVIENLCHFNLFKNKSFDSNKLFSQESWPHQKILRDTLFRMNLKAQLVEFALVFLTVPSPMFKTTLKANIFQTASHTAVLNATRMFPPKKP